LISLIGWKWPTCGHTRNEQNAWSRKGTHWPSSIFPPVGRYNIINCMCPYSEHLSGDTWVYILTNLHWVNCKLLEGSGKQLKCIHCKPSLWMRKIKKFVPCVGLVYGFKLFNEATIFPGNGAAELVTCPYLWRKERVYLLSNVYVFQPSLHANKFNVPSLKVYAGVTTHSSGVYAKVLLLTVQQSAHKGTGVFYNVMEYFSIQKVWLFRKVSCAVQLKAKEERLLIKMNQIFLPEDPTMCCMVKSSRGTLKFKFQFFLRSSIHTR